MNKLSSSQVVVWHELFQQGPTETLVKMLQEGMVPEPCVLPSGQDLLKTLLLRECPGILGNTRSNTFRKEPRLQQLWSSSSYLKTWGPRLDYQRAAVLLMDRSDVQVFEDAPLGEQTSLGLAVSVGLAAVAEAIFDRMTPGQKQAAQERAVAEQWVHRAVSKEALPLLRVLLENDCSAVSLDPSGRTPLFHATDVEVATLLLESGASLDETAGKVTLSEHWARQLRAEKYGNSSLEALIEMGRHASLDPHQKLASDMVRAVSWFESVDVFAHVGQQGLRKMGGEWEQGWKDIVEPLLAVAPAMHTWQRFQDSGLLKGNVTLPAALAGKWLNTCFSNEKSGSKSFGIHLALMEKPERLLGAEPALVRRGVTDWGLWALAAVVHKPVLNQRETQDLKDLSHKSEQECERIMALRAPEERWVELALETAATLQRPRNKVLWKRIGGCVESLIDQVITKEQKRKASLLGSSRLAAIHGNYKGWLVANQAMEAGVRLCSGVNSLALIKKVIEWGENPSMTVLSDLPKEKFDAEWFVLALVTFVDHALILQEEQDFIKTNQYGASLKVLASLLENYVTRLEGHPQLPPASASRIEEGLPLLFNHGGQYTLAKLKELKLSGTLSERSSTEVVIRKGPRL